MQPAHSATQFLSSALSQRGPDALPYAEDSKYLIRHHLVSLAEAFPSLTVRASHFVHNDGRSSRLLQAEGTIPMTYGGATYNLPAAIWLLEPYPRCPPAVYLSPTRDMIVKPNHPHVDRSGHVSVPYLHSWIFPSSNLVDLVRSLSQIFSLDPPLYTRQHPQPPPTTATATFPPQGYTRVPPPVNNPPYSTSPYGAPTTRPPEDAAEVFRRNAVNKLVERVHEDALGLRRSAEAEMEGLLVAQAELKQREEKLGIGFNMMQGEKEGLEQQLQIALMNADILGAWVRDNESRKATAAVDVDDVFEPIDGLSKQMLECTAADMAVDDTVYALEKALHEGVISFEMYVRNVRVLSREQFFHRATMLKVKAAQVHMRISSMADRAGQRGAQFVPS